MKNRGESLRRAYESWHENLPFAPDQETPWFRMLASHLDPARDLADRTVLEVGCGRGELSWWLADRLAPPRRMIAGDFALTAVRKGAAHNRLRSSHAVEGVAPPRWHVVDICHLSLPDACCDTVISCETVEHVSSPRAAIHELARVLKPGGRLFLTTPNYLNLVGLYRAYRRLIGRPFREAGQPINRLMNLPRVLWTVRGAGLRTLRVDGTVHPLPLPGGALELRLLDRLGPVGRWTGVQSLVVAEKPAALPRGATVTRS